MFIHVFLLCGHSVHPRFLLGGGKGVEPPTKFSKRGVGVGGLGPTSTLRGGFQEKMGLWFYKKSKAKSEIFSDKKSL